MLQYPTWPTWNPSRNREVLFFPAGLLWLQGCNLISRIKKSWAWNKVKVRSTMGQFMQAGISWRDRDTTEGGYVECRWIYIYICRCSLYIYVDVHYQFDMLHDPSPRFPNRPHGMVPQPAFCSIPARKLGILQCFFASWLDGAVRKPLNS